MKIACYCQHVLGIGHFHRCLEICKTLAARHDTVMIIGGPDVSLPESAVRFLQLPGLKMDENFSRLIPCQEGADLEEVKEARKQQLSRFFSSFQPDIFLVELYPFGRKAFRFELDPILDGIGSGPFASCLRLCSLRDILVEKKDREKYETRVINLLDSSFDGLLIHSDPDFIPLEKTFTRTEAIPVPSRYTGFIAPPAGNSAKGERIRRELGLSATDSLVVASIGGGNVGAELLRATAEAAVVLKDRKDIHFHLFTGIYSDPDLQAELRNYQQGQITAHDFCANFPDWLEAGDLSISMAGYNTCMNLLASGIPALLYPFAQNREQLMRVSAFANAAAFSLLETADLAPERLAEYIREKLHCKKHLTRVKLNGAATSCRLIEDPTIWKRT
ncbi:MAG: glycosyl transferase [Desulfocapsa sp.]|nr:glycosyl transferase [Desulfocapsa sp.]